MLLENRIKKKGTNTVPFNSTLDINHFESQCLSRQYHFHLIDDSE